MCPKQFFASKTKLNIGKHASYLPNTYMAHLKQLVKAMRHFACDHCHTLVDYLVWMRKVLGRDSRGRAYFSVRVVLEGGLSNNWGS